MSAPLYKSNAPIYGANDSGVASEDIRASAVAAEEAAAPATDKRVNVISPKDGETYSLPESQLQQAIGEGYKLETPEQRALREFHATHKGTSDVVDATIAKFLDEATFGALSVKSDPLTDANRERLLKEHSTARKLALGAGFAGSLGVGEGLGLFKAAGKAGELVTKGIEGLGGEAVGNALARLAPEGAEEAAAKVGPSLAKQLVAHGAGHAVEGALLTAPRALTEASLGDPEEAAETLLFGAGAGALFGMVGPATKAITKGVETGNESLLAKALPEAAEGESYVSGKLRKFSDKQVIKSFNPLKKFSKKIDGIGEEEVADVARKYDLMPKFGQTAEDVAESVAAKRAEVGAKIGSIVEDASGKAPRVSAGEVANVIEKHAEALETGAESLGAAPIRRKLRELADNSVKAFPNDLTLEELDKVRQYIGDNIPDSEKSKGMRKAIGSLYHSLNDLFFQKAEAALGGEKAALDELRQLKGDYRALIPLSEATKENIARGLANRGHSLTDYVGNMIGGVVGSAVGHPFAGSLAGGAINKLGRLYGNRYVAEGAEALANWLDSSAARNPLDAGGLLGIEQAQKYSKEMLDEIGPALSGESKMPSSLGGEATYAAAEFIRQFTEGHAESGAKLESFKTLAKDLTALAADPARMQAAIETAIAPYSKSAPNASTMYAAKLGTTLTYLHETMPKNPAAPNPFIDREWKPSDAEMAMWARRWHTTLDPFSTVHRVMDGSLRKEDVETLRRVYPRLYQRIVASVVDYGSSPDVKPLPYGRRMKLAMLLDSPVLEPSIASIGSLQALHAAAPKQEQGEGPAPVGPRAKVRPDAFAGETDVQRVMAK